MEGFADKMHDRMVAVEMAVKAVDFDPLAVEEAQQKLAALRLEMDRTIADFMNETLPKLSQEGRAKLQLLPPHARKNRK